MAENDTQVPVGISTEPPAGASEGTQIPPNPQRGPTYGERAVGITFNPSGDDRVNTVKRQFADLIDLLSDIRMSSGQSEKSRLASIAITEAQAAQMWAVKAITFEQ